MAALEVESLIDPSYLAQIAALELDKVLLKISAKYIDYTDVYSSDQAREFSNNTSINEHPIELVKDKQPAYGPIYALSLVELKTSKIYIENHLKTGFIQSFKSFACALILLDKKLNDSFRLCVDY